MRPGRSTPRILACLAAVVFVAASAMPGARQDSDSDLDEFMAQVLARREESWRTLRQYILDERETIQLHGPGQLLLHGSRREYTWFPREGVFVRSPVRANGVSLDEATRRRAEDEWLRQEARREARRDDPGEPPPGDVEPAADGSAADVLPESLEPRFVSSAYFLRFRFDPGQYALVGREQLGGRDVLRIEYYPTSLFREDRDRGRPRGRQAERERERDENINAAMNKTSLVTLWIAPEARQIVQYEFENVDMDFLPGRAFIRVDEIRASMRMGEPFPGVWLPQSIAMRFALFTALGPVTGRYDTEYHDYRLAEVTTRIQ